MHSRSFLAENNKLVHSKMLIRLSSDMFNLRIRVCSRKDREYLQNGSSNPPGKLCNRIFGPFLLRKQLTILLVRADHPKVPLPPPPKITTVHLLMSFLLVSLSWFSVTFLLWERMVFIILGMQE